MPLEQCEVSGRKGWRWGKSGKCYTGIGAKKKAIKQGVAEAYNGSSDAQAEFHTKGN